MTDARTQQPEPSMEEILSSIRRIISEDGQRERGDPAPPLAAEPLAPATIPDEAVEEEVLELTEEVAEPSTEPEPVLEEEPLSLTEAPMPLEPAAASVAPAAATPRAPASTGRLISEPTELAAAAALSILAQLVNPDRQLNAEGREMIESAIRDKIEPLLRDWLDGNLPQLVERLVREEIQRVMDRALNRNA